MKVCSQQWIAEYRLKSGAKPGYQEAWVCRTMRCIWWCCLFAAVAWMEGGIGTICFAQANSPVHTLLSVSIVDVLEQTLVRHPQLNIQRQEVVLNKGILQQASGIFDTALSSDASQSRTNTPLTLVNQITAEQALSIPENNQAINLTTIDAGAAKLFRNGISVSPSFFLTRDTDNLLAASGVNTSHVGLLVTIPLLRGRGYNAVGAQERASAIEVESSIYDLNHLVAQLVTKAMTSYWTLVAARRSLEIAASTEERGRTLVENVNALIEADQVPRSDINDVSANLADRVSARLSAEQDVIVARTQLAIDMGLSGNQVSIGDPSASLPDFQGQTIPDNSQSGLTALMQEASLRRADLIAARKRIGEAHVFVVEAQNRILPDVSLNLNLGYSGLKEGTALSRYLAAPFTGIRGIDLTAGVSYRFPIGNNVAAGQLTQSKASEQQSNLRYADIERNIDASVLTSVEAIRHAVKRIETSRESVNAFMAALSSQRERYRLGSSSVVEVLTLEDRLNTALLNQVQAELNYATALVQFRFAIGAIVDPEKPVQVIDPQLFLTLPQRTLSAKSYTKP